jgi:hypothetical protein
MRSESLMVRQVSPNGRSPTPLSGGGRDRKAPKSKRNQEKGKRERHREETERKGEMDAMGMDGARVN